MNKVILLMKLVTVWVTYTLLFVDGAAVVVSNRELKAMILKLQKDVSELKRKEVKPMGHCTNTKCGKCQCVEDQSIPEKHYCDCRVLPAMRDCKAFYLTGNYIRGIYTVTMNGLQRVNVFCDGNGWTVIQRRIDGSTNFYRSWEQYKNGFGKLQGEFWLGNENIFFLSAQAMYPKGSELEILMKSPRSWDITYLAFYKHFSIDSETANYKLHVKYNHGNPGDSLTYHDNMEFSTFDRDNDKHDKKNCAREHHGAWWYNACAKSNLNGHYDTLETGKPETKVDWESLLYFRTQGWVEMKVTRITA